MTSLALSLVAVPIGADPVATRPAPSNDAPVMESATEASLDFSTLGTTLLSASFDDGSAAGFGLSGLWHVDSCHSMSPAYSLGYNNGGCPGHFSVGHTFGSAVSPPIPLPSGAATVGLAFDSWYQTEEPGTTYDVKLVQVSTDGGNSWSTVHQVSGTMNSWSARTVDLTAYAGATVTVRFHFDSIDGAFNGYQGWFVDNIVVAAEIPILSAAFDDGSTGGFTVGGLWHVSDCRSASPSFSLGYNTGACPPHFAVGHTAGNAVSPTLYVGGTITLSYSSWYQTEETGTSYDVKLVQVSTDGGLSWTTVDQVSGTMNTWTTRSVDLSAYGGGALLVQFRFDSIDGAFNNYEGWYVDNVVVTGEPVILPPSAPAGLSAGAGPGAGELTLAWSAPNSDGGSPISGYNVYAADDAAGPFGLIGTTLASELGFVEIGLANAQTRHYQVTAMNGAGEGPASEVASATTFDVPSAPFGLSASPGSAIGAVDVSWSMPDSDGGTPITAYNIYRSTSPSSGFAMVGSVAGDTLSFTDNGDLLRTYYYHVTALNIAGESDPSNGDCSKPYPWVELSGDRLCWLPSPP